MAHRKIKGLEVIKGRTRLGKKSIRKARSGIRKSRKRVKRIIKTF